LLRDADIAVKTILDAMSDALADGHRIEIRGFGSFGLNRRPPRVGRNPKSGEKVLVPEKRVPHFKAGKELRERVDRSLERQGEPSSEGEPAVSLAAVKAARQIDSARQAAGFPVEAVVPLVMSR
jgi:integration host factor subunit beta